MATAAPEFAALSKVTPTETAERYPSKLDYSQAKDVARREFGYVGGQAAAFASGYLASRDQDWEFFSILDDSQRFAAETGWTYFQVYAT